MDVTAIVVKSLVLYSLAEHQAGFAHTLDVQVHGSRFFVGDDGRGHAIDRVVEGEPYFSLIYEQLRSPAVGDGHGPVQLQGIGVSLVNALCSELEVLIHNANGSVRLSYADGELRAQERIQCSAIETGNRIRGVISATLHSEECADGQLRGWLEDVQRRAPALSLRFNGSLLGVGAQGAA